MKLASLLLLSLFLATGCKTDGDGIIDPTLIDGTQDPRTGAGADDPSLGDADPNCVEKLGLDKVSTKAPKMSEVIIGDNTWVSTGTITDTVMKANAQATVYVSMSNSRCTGFLVNEDMIMTNNHCIGSASQARGVIVRFNWVSGTSYEQYTCDEFVMTNSALDFTLVKCKNSPGKNHPQVVLADFQGRTGDSIYLTHQNCDYRYGGYCSPTQKLSTGVLLGSNSTQVKHNADTLGGSSGSPIFDKESHKVVAIHNAGLNHGPDNGGTNYGVPMYRIVDYIRNNNPSVKINSSGSRSPAHDVCD